ncbi:MAG: 16S rRNA (cytidine(1402)-2'-O)-methyltransferase [Desulfonatronovibrio sp.]|nr:16S rRNA (cytidine(1402)-2'-O)-methyltransferase [Desulfovibrionales bacterium]
MSKTQLNSALWVVATPLGNLGDISRRAVCTLKNAAIIFAEDTRRAGHLLDSLEIKGPRFLSLHEHNEEQRIKIAIEQVEAGNDCCLVSDAGTPLLADPGYRLVRTFRQKNLPVIPVPGPCAPIAALMASGIAPYPFTFLGFLPRKKGELESLFTKWKDVPGTLVFFERKNRVTASLSTAFEILGPREFCIAREMTKKFEEFIPGKLGETIIYSDNLLGEITIIIGPASKDTTPTGKADLLKVVNRHIQEGCKLKHAARLASQECTGWNSKQIYNLMIHKDN